jgi:hypothetical protein
VRDPAKRTSRLEISGAGPRMDLGCRGIYRDGQDVRATGVEGAPQGFSQVLWPLGPHSVATEALGHPNHVQL